MDQNQSSSLEMIGIEEKDTALRAMAGVAGGCWRGDLCGAISGAAMVIGSLFARADLQEVEDPRLKAIMRAFR